MRTILAVALSGVLLWPANAAPQQPRFPAAVQRLEVQALAGTWHEVASSGVSRHGPCVANVSFEWVLRGMTAIDVTRRCSAASGSVVRRGRMRIPRTEPQGRLSIRFTPAVVAWLPAVWDDHWILAIGPDHRWLLIGDRTRRHFSVLSRWLSLDEASLARAIAAARSQGFDVSGLLAGAPAGARSKRSADARTMLSAS